MELLTKDSAYTLASRLLEQGMSKDLLAKTLLEVQDNGIRIGKTLTAVSRFQS